jgi:hypothetical protein
MADMTNSDFIDKIFNLRKSLSQAEFKSEVSQIAQFITIVDIIKENTIKWASSCGLIGEKNQVDDANLSSHELLWTEYFKDHSFSSIEDQRNLADALTILTGIEMTRFIRVINRGKDHYPAHIVIVPTGGSGGHNYRIGDPVISFGAGSTFYKRNGESGNNMTTNLRDIRLPSREEIEDIVLCTMYRMDSIAEYLVSNLLGG